jgi:hypothetical protein
MLDDELERLAGAVSQQDLPWMRGDAEATEHQSEMLSQGQIAERIPIFEQIGAVLARETSP